MHLVKTQLIRRGIPPLPPATMVIDMRGEKEGEAVTGMLKGEIRNLAEEMKQQNIHLWGSLADFISFKVLGTEQTNDTAALIPLSPSYPDQYQDQSDSFTSRSGNDQYSDTYQPGEITLSSLANASEYESKSEEEQTRIIPLQASFEELPDEIDRLRNARINALSNLGTDGTAGNNWKEEAARVIFLADAKDPGSLSSVAACAKHLKDYYRRFERPNKFGDKQSLINISVLCLNHESLEQSQAPESLIQGLSPDGDWQHLDSLILSETHRRDMARIDQTMQNLFAELLLYVLLLVSPTLTTVQLSDRPEPRHKLVNPPATTKPEDKSVDSTSISELEDKSENTDKRAIRLPSNTFLVGLSTIENSTRWGYRLLNYGLAEKALQTLRENIADDEQDTQQMVERWLDDLQKQVRSALSEGMPDNIHDLEVLASSLKTASPVEEVFAQTQLSPLQGQRSIYKVEQYLSDVTTTYAGSSEVRSNSSSPQLSSSHGLLRSPTLENAVLSVPRIQDALDQWDDDDPQTLLIQAQLSAYRVLSHRLLYRGPHGAIRRALLQLTVLARVIDERQEKRRQNPLDVKAKQETLRKSGQNQIDGLKKHVEQWPFFASLLRLKTPMAWAATISLAFLCFVFLTLGFAWLEQLVLPVNSILNAPLFGISAFTPFHLLLWLALGTLIAIVLFVFGRFLSDLHRSALMVESTFGIIVFLIALSGLAIWLSYGSTATPTARAILSWYPLTLSGWISIIAFFVVFVMVIVEYIFYSAIWKKELKNRREEAVGTIQGEHQRSVEEVTAFIVDMLTLHLLTRAGLANDQTGKSPYYRRMVALNRLLLQTHNEIADERKIAELRLGSGIDETHLYLRQELLDVARLKNSYRRWRGAMDDRMPELVELSMMLLRAMGEENPDSIERQFRDESISTTAEPHNVRILLEMLTAIAIRFATAMPSSDMLTSLTDRYEKLDRRVIGQFSTLSPLVDVLHKKVRAANLDEDDGSLVVTVSKKFDTSLATQALIGWGQMLWEQKDTELKSVLAPGGVIARLMRDNYNPQTLKEELLIRASSSGRSAFEGLYGREFLFVTSSPASRMFWRDAIPMNYITDFPDPERLLLMYVQYYYARPLDIQ